VSEPETLSIVIPVFNEQDVLEEMLARTLAVAEALPEKTEIVLVDDGSIDRSMAIISEAAEKHPETVVGVILNRNYGQHAAVMAGFARSRGEWVVTLDADLQNPPEEIPKIVEKLREGFDVVGSIRVPREDTFFRRMASRVVNRTVRKSTGVGMRDYGCMLRGYRRRIITAMLACQERSTFIPVLANSFARKVTEVEVRHAARPTGTSRYGFLKLVNLQFDLLTSITTAPLRLLMMFGTVICGLGGGLGVLILVLRLIYGSDWAVGGVFTLFAVLFMLVGLQFIGMGLLGEYIGRIYTDVRGRPRYYVEEEVGRGIEGDAS
jgi:undecaprenyl-phosphate 4-deoxy-4-formamido-L-arabinose transferase